MSTEKERPLPEVRRRQNPPHMLTRDVPFSAVLSLLLMRRAPVRAFRKRVTQSAARRASNAPRRRVLRVIQRQRGK